MIYSKFSCYLISSNYGKNGRTYVGVTSNLKKRIRQHNGEIVGGAKSTANKGVWSYVCILTGFKSQRDALQFEWRMHHPPKKGRSGIKGRLNNMQDIFKLDKWTKNSELVELDKMKLIWINQEHMKNLSDSLPSIYDPTYPDRAIDEPLKVDADVGCSTDLHYKVKDLGD
ncbi:structure-specific endonuclease subunit SLX1 [Acrasis kona]|uniref:Structure-specific endonuclease subunit SLX1 n=1 Tax=Acrasis kona TaxID=1008807 RepID=A0AAW2YYR1_9EUKA